VGITTVGLVVRLEADVVPDVPAVLPGELVCELVQPATAAAQQIRSMIAMNALSFIPDDDKLVYLSVAIFGTVKRSEKISSWLWGAG
jgi:hypothetical protein